jgi:DNA-3-methyladenine glycosylase I
MPAMSAMDPSLPRCGWATSDPVYLVYHDEEWGVPVHDDRRLFEMLILEGAQAGLSWITILKRREGYRRAFEGFDPQRIARYGKRDVARLLADPGIIRNRAKVEAAIKNAKAVLTVVEEAGSFDRFLWPFVGGAPKVNRWRTLKEIPAETPESKAMSKELKRRGFGFVGPTICYAFMQAVGMVDDHVLGCFRRQGRTTAKRR